MLMEQKMATTVMENQMDKEHGNQNGIVRGKFPELQGGSPFVQQLRHALCRDLGDAIFLRTLGGTPNRDPCSLWGLIWGVPRHVGVT